ncbi:MAG: MFS transporter, partial [Firmicutes bacterium]|nr:MFS transporter [Bacillota bacterium]
MNKFQQFIHDVKEEFTWKGFLTVVGAFLFSLSIVGLHGVVKNQFTLPISEALGVTKAEVAIWNSAASVAGVIFSALIGFIYKKLGPRGLAMLGGSLVAIGYLMIAYIVKDLKMLYVSGLFIGAGNVMAGGLMFYTLVKPWWDKAFGTFAALCGTASGVGGVLFVTTVTKSLQEGGYQAGALKVAIFTLIFSFLGSFLMTESPNDVLRNQAKAEKEAKARGEKIEKAKKEEVKGPAEGIPALDYIDFLKEPLTWLLFIMMCMALFNVATAIFSPMAKWKGYAEPNVVGGAALTMYSALLIWTKLGAGALR